MRVSCRLGFEPLDVTKHIRSAGDVGTFVHAAIEAYLLGMALTPPPEFTEAQQRQALWAYASFLLWWEEHKGRIEILAIERRFFRPDLGYAGTVDLVYRDANGHIVLLDWKTATRIKPWRYSLQLVAYAAGLNDWLREPVHRCEVIRLDKKEALWEPFEVPRADALRLWPVVQHMGPVAEAVLKAPPRYRREKV